MKKNLLFYLIFCNELAFATTKPTPARVLESQMQKALTESVEQQPQGTNRLMPSCSASVNLATLNSGTNSLPFTCKEGNFLYYGKDSTFQFAIDWNGNVSARDSSLVSIGLLPSNHVFAGALGASEVMRRYWNVNLKGQTLTNPVKIRFYYENTEFANVQAFSPSRQWFMMNSGVFDPLNVNNYNVMNGALIAANITNLTNKVTYGTTANGVAYAEITDLMDLTGGTFAADAAVGGSALYAKVFLNNVNPSTGLMDNDLATIAPNFPLSDPYRTSPLNSSFIHVNNTVTAVTTPAVINAAQGNAVVDWVFVELRTGVSGSTNVVATSPGLLQRDGDIVNVDGVSSLYFNVPTGYYYIAIRHRNNTGFRTASPILLNTYTPPLNFTNNSIPLYGLIPVTVIPYSNSNIRIMVTGDSNNDGAIDSLDMVIWQQQNGDYDDYLFSADFNLDASVDSIDAALWQLNNGAYEELD
jgi:hypothetical protein